MLKVYFANISELDLETDITQLSAYRQKKLERIRPVLKRRQEIGAELLLNYAVRRSWPELELPLKIEAGERGKPFCRALPGYFSLSHSGAYVLCAVSSQELGADIQKKEGCRKSVLERCFASDEQGAVLRALDQDAEFTRIWALKESYIKAIGSGLSMPLNSFSVIEETKKAVYGFWHTEFGEYQVAVCVHGMSDPYPDAFEEINVKTRAN